MLSVDIVGLMSDDDLGVPPDEHDGTGVAGISSAEALTCSREAVERQLQLAQRLFRSGLVLMPLGYVALLVFWPFGDGGMPLVQAVPMGIFFGIFMGLYFWLTMDRPQTRRLRELQESGVVEPVEVLAKGKTKLTVGRLGEGGEEIFLLVSGKPVAGLDVGQRGWRHFSPTKRGLSTVIARTTKSSVPIVAGPTKTRVSG